MYHRDSKKYSTLVYLLPRKAKEDFRTPNALRPHIKINIDYFNIMTFSPDSYTLVYFTPLCDPLCSCIKNSFIGRSLLRNRKSFN